MRRFSLKSFEAELLNTSGWPSIDSKSFEDPIRQMIEHRQTAVRLLIEDASDETIKTKTGISRVMAIYCFKRCIQLHPDGRIWGFRVLAPHTHTKEYTRTKELPVGQRSETAGWAGSLGMFFARFPQVKALVDRHIFKLDPSTYVYESRVKLKSLHKRMVGEAEKLVKDECKRLGISSDDMYPMNTDTRAHRALSNYIHREMKEHSAEAIAANCGPNALRLLQTGDGTKKPVLRPFDRLEGDAHKIDGRWIIQIPSIFGNVITKTVDRVWDIVLRDPVSDVVFSHYLSHRKEINKDDFLEALHRALSFQERRPLRIPQLTYRDGAGFPASLDPRFQGAKIGHLSVDGALAETCAEVKGKMKDCVGCETVTLHRRNPNDREIEGYFGILEEDGFHRLPNTTGTGPADPRRNLPDKAAQTHGMQLEDLSELLDVMHANHNVKPSTALGGRSPMAHLKHLCETMNCWPEKISAEKIDQLLVTRTSVTVRGDFEKCIRPYINFVGVRYTNSALREAFGMIGQEITLEIPTDIVTVRAFSHRGAELGPLIAASPWNRTPHTQEIRRAILKLQRDGQMHDYVKNHDPIIDYLDYLEELARKGKSIPPEYLVVRDFLTKRLYTESTEHLIGTVPEVINSAAGASEPSVTTSPNRMARRPFLAVDSSMLFKKGING